MLSVQLAEIVHKIEMPDVKMVINSSVVQIGQKISKQNAEADNKYVVDHRRKSVRIQ